MKTTLARNPIRRIAVTASLLAAAMTAAASAAQAEVINRGIEGKPLHEARPAPKSIFPDEHIIVAQPSPSEVNPSFLGPVLLMKSAHRRSGSRHHDAAAAPRPAGLGRSRLVDPHRCVGREPRQPARRRTTRPRWPTASPARARARAASKRMEASPSRRGKVDFSPEHVVTPGDAPNFFPPKRQARARWAMRTIRRWCSSTTPRAPSSTCRWWPSTSRAEELDAMCDGKVDHAQGA